LIDLEVGDLEQGPILAALAEMAQAGEDLHSVLMICKKVWGVL
jgi:hypothetical protein